MGGRTNRNWRRGWVIATALVAALTAVPSVQAFDWGGTTRPMPTEPTPIPPTDVPPAPPVDTPPTPPSDTPPTEPPPAPPVDTPPPGPEVPPGSGNPPTNEEPPIIDVPTMEVPPTQESPEPATIGLAFLGAAAVYVRRKK